MIRTGRVPHAFLIEAPMSVDKEAFALSFAQALLCAHQPGVGCGICSTCKRIVAGSHLDVTLVEATAKGSSKVKSVKDDDVTTVLDRLRKKPMEGSRSIAIIKDCDTMSSKAFNHFLKTLEEPGEGTVIMLLSENTESLLPTIRSRCVQLRLNPFGDVEENPALKDAAEFVRLAGEENRFFETGKITERYAKDRTEAYLFLDAVLEVLGEQLKEHASVTARERAYAGISACEEAREQIRRGETVAWALRRMTIKIGEAK